VFFTNGISRVFGKFASKEFSKPIQKFINISYVKLLKLDMSEFLSPEEYKSLNALFTRELQNSRKIPSIQSKFISPTDSLVTQFGKINRGVALQIKGMDYSVSKLLGESISKKALGRLEGGDYMNFYLSPKDYHHYHMPYSAKINRVVHFGGKLYPVNIPYLNKKLDLFIENERVVLECESGNGKLFYLVLVGALNVGKMVLKFEDRVETNIQGNGIETYEYENLFIKKGEDLGYFRMGSTVVLISEKGFLEPKISLFEKVKFGSVVAEVNK
jgi:phosphatidylserine decarboxylase